MTSKIELSHRTVFFVFALIGLTWLITQIWDILFLLFVAFILMSALRPVVGKLVSFRVPRMLAILLVYGGIFGLFSLVIAGVLPPLVTQSTRLIQEFPGFIERLLPYWDVNISSFTDQIAPISQNLVKFTLGIFTNFLTVVTVLVFAFYFLLERSYLDHFLIGMFGEAAGKKTSDIIQKVEWSLGQWLLGELALMLSIGVLTYVGLLALKIEYALPLAILAGLLEIIPSIGPTISAIPAILVALTFSPLLALAVGVLYFIIQQLENNIFVPVVMRRAVGLPPLVTILSLLIGGRLAGLGGAIFAVPIVVMLHVIITESLVKKS